MTAATLCTHVCTRQLPGMVLVVVICSVGLCAHTVWEPYNAHLYIEDIVQSQHPCFASNCALPLATLLLSCVFTLTCMATCIWENSAVGGNLRSGTVMHWKKKTQHQNTTGPKAETTGELKPD